MKGLLRARPLPLDEPSAKKVANFGDGAIQGKTPTGLKTHLRLSAVGGFCDAHGVSGYIWSHGVTPKTEISRRV